MPGCGKTVLSSAIIDDLSKDHLQVLLYFFFDFSVPEKQSLDNMLRSLITQLYRQRKETRFHLDKLWRSFGEGSKQPTVESLEKAFRGMIDDTKDVKLVLDALDESQTRDDLLEWLQAVFQSTNVRLIVTSRREGDIEAAFTAVAQPEDVVPIQRSDVNKDIGAYVCHKVRNDPKLKRWRSFPDVQKEIESALMQKADGM